MVTLLKLFTGANRKLTLILLPGLFVAGFFCNVAVQNYLDGYHFDDGTFFDIKGMLYTLGMFISALVFFFGVVGLFLDGRFTKKWGIVYFITFGLWWVCFLPSPTYTDGMKKRLLDDISEAQLFRLAADARKTGLLKNETPEQTKERTRLLSLQNSFLNQLFEIPPIINVFPSHVDIIWEFEGNDSNGFYGIRIMDQSSEAAVFGKDNKNPESYSQSRQVYQRVWVHMGRFQ